ncbi:hypothetical protein [Vibrio quintilis]|uniref:Uncharacterized protein n=1 Tax=Vibrio quintilis TaxID=1117707 RepID=A0A1M7YUL0_9VIBR|nr:hypothetical protein [Vibrio quintilis]SHO56357.1 hypothetical protein VQ7734_02126 [Vibrio quintilis]
MFMIEGVCDWCKQPSLLTPHQYLDGKVYCSCKDCYEFACMDVRLYNQEEEAAQFRTRPKFSAQPTPA